MNLKIPFVVLGVIKLVSNRVVVRFCEAWNLSGKLSDGGAAGESGGEGVVRVGGDCEGAPPISLMPPSQKLP